MMENVRLESVLEYVNIFYIDYKQYVNTFKFHILFKQCSAMVRMLQNWDECITSSNFDGN